MHPVIDKQFILLSLDETTRELLSTIGSFTPEHLNTIPFEGSWTAGQVAEHLLKSESGIPEVLTGPVVAAVRPIDEMVPAIESVFLDFTTRLKSPDFILPSDEPKDKQVLLDAFEFVRSELKKIAGSADLSKVCTSFPFPQMGELTRLEWLHFAICHSKRHIRQMKNIKAAL